MNDIIETSQGNFEQIVLKSECPVLVDFWAPWCSPCKQLMPILEELAEAYQNQILVVKVNADENQEIAKKYNVRGLPTVILFVNGQDSERFVGLQTKSRIAAFIDRQIGE